MSHAPATTAASRPAVAGLACGNREYPAMLVALNSVFLVVMDTVLGELSLRVVAPWSGVAGTAWHISLWAIASRTILLNLADQRLADLLPDRAWAMARLPVHSRDTAPMTLHRTRPRGPGGESRVQIAWRRGLPHLSVLKLSACHPGDP